MIGTMVQKYQIGTVSSQMYQVQKQIILQHVEFHLLDRESAELLRWTGNSQTLQARKNRSEEKVMR